MKKRYFLFIFSSSLAFSSVVDPSFYYQDYLDFASNKGKFKIGNENISIISKDSTKIISLNAPMVDFSATNFNGRLKGEFTNIGGSYVVSAAHMTWGEKGSGANKGPIKQGNVLHFANIPNRVVSASNNFRSRDPFDIDFAIFKMQKLNINKSANISQELNFIRKISDNESESLRYTDILDDSNDFSQGKGVLFDSTRYTYFAREGSGIQGIGDKDIDIKPNIISKDDKYHTGGFVTLDQIYKPDLINSKKRFLLPFANFNGNIRNDFTSSSAPGDSGSALYVYDNLDKKWYLIGVISTSDCTKEMVNGYNCTVVSYALINQPLINEFKEIRTINIAGGNYILNHDSLSQNGKKINGIEFISSENTGYITYNNIYAVRNKHDNRIKEMEKSKDLYFNQNGKITLQEDVDLGASVFNFTPKSFWEINGDFWLINGGIYTDSNSKVIYNAKLQKDDFLHKMGQGELQIKSSNPNSGLRMGEGLVTLLGSGEKFGEIYINGGTLKLSDKSNIDFNKLYLNGGTLDLNGTSLETNKIMANSNNVFLTSSKDNASFKFNQANNYIYHGNIIGDKDFNIKIENSQDLIFDGNIYHNNSILTASNSSFNFQGHPIVHATLSEELAQKLQALGEPILTKSVSLTQEDWENRIFSLKEMQLDNSTFSLSSYATLNVENLNAKDSKIFLGSQNLSVDELDSQNISHIDNSIFSYGHDDFSGVGKEMSFKEEIKNTNNAEVKEVYFKGNLNLNNSSAFIYKTNFIGNINGNSNEKPLILSHSNFMGNIYAKNVNLMDNPLIFGSIQTQNLYATNSTFKLNIDLQNAKSDTIISTNNTSGANNSLLLNFLTNSSSKDSKILLASLKDKQNKINQNYFTIPNIEYGFSIYSPNIEFNHDTENATWELISIANTENQNPNQPNQNPSYFHTSNNEQALKTANSLTDHFILNYIAEWNNLQKRMGELRDNPNDYGIWIRTFGGKLSDNYNSGNYFEVQSGFDKQNKFQNFNLYSGIMLNFTHTKLDSNSLNATSKGYGIGNYLSFLFDNGFYIDGVLRYIRYENNMNANFIPNTPSVNLNSKDSNNIIASIEMGYRKNFDNFYLEPQIEFISGYVDSINLSNELVRIQMNSYVPLVLKTALFGGINNLKNSNLNLRVGVGYMSDLRKSGTKSFGDNTGVRSAEGLRDDRAFINFNTSYNLSQNMRISLDYEKSFLGDLNIDWSLNANLRYSF